MLQRKRSNAKSTTASVALGKTSLGDIRCAKLDGGELHYACPPIGLIDEMLMLLQEAKVPTIFVVPNWEGKAWHVWLRERAEDVALLPWSDWPVTWFDFAEKKSKRHEVASKWHFVVMAVDFRKEERN